MECYSGLTIILIFLLACLFNDLTFNSPLLGVLIFVGSILFYLNQRIWTGCTYPDPNR